MNRNWLAVAAALATAASAARVEAQARSSISIIPIAGYMVPMGKWTDSDTIRLEPGGGIFVGVTAEYSMNKSVSITAQALRTLGLTQTMTMGAPTFFGTTKLETDMTSTQILGTIIFRPLGRLPNGAPKTVYFEVGGGFTLYDVGQGFQNPSGQNDVLDFNSSTAMIAGGAGLSFPIGPRASLQVFGRANYQLSEYSSEGLDTWNGYPPPSSVQGEKSLVMLLGAGLRIGR